MSAHITIDQTPTGWKIEVTEGDQVILETDGPRLALAVHPDDDDTPTKPLDVQLQ
jgi:hypothetical protein